MIFFVDMDGVLCTPRANLARNSFNMWNGIDPVCVALFNRWIALAERLYGEVDLVVSSAWRYDMTGHSAIQLLGAIGIEGNIHPKDWKTRRPHEVGENHERGYQIHDWLERNKPDAYVIVDDSADFLDYQKPHLIRCETYDGITHRVYLDGVEKIGNALKGNCDGTDIQ